MIPAAAYELVDASGLNAVARFALRGQLLVVCYHGVCAGAKTDVHDPDGMHVPEGRFAEQVDFILSRYRAVSPGELRAALRGGHPLPERAVLFTFDDGYRNLAANALPLLRRCNVVPALFVVASLVERGEVLWTARVMQDPSARPQRARLKAMPSDERTAWLAAHVPFEDLSQTDHGLMTWAELASLEHVEIGSHGHTHAPLVTCDESELAHELSASRALIGERLGREVRCVAYPNGDCNPAVARAAEQAGFDLGFTTAARHVAREGRLELPRVLVGAHDTPARLATRLSGVLEYLR